MQIKVGSLNFSGINISPFEYYDGSQEKTHLNHLFVKKLSAQYKQLFAESPKLAKIDKSFQKDRYTLLYRSDVGVVRGKLINKKEFSVLWDLAYDSLYQGGNVQDQSLNVVDYEELEKLKVFDSVLYEVFLQSVFGEINWQIIKEYDSCRYLNALKQYHSKSYLKEDYKIQLLFWYIQQNDLDFMFVQQASVQGFILSIPPQYSYVYHKQSMIIFKKDLVVLNQQTDHFIAKYNNLLNFNDDTVYFRSEEYLLISSHLSSKKCKVQQAQCMKQTLNQIMVEYPHLKIIVGIDANQSLKSMDSFNVFPLSQHHFTTRKRRTDMQLQFSKAGIIAQDIRDHIITNLLFQQSIVQTIRGKSIGNELLPNQKHPFDHFVVRATIINEDVVRKRRNTLPIMTSPIFTKIPFKKSNTMSSQGTNTTQDLSPKNIFSHAQQPSSLNFIQIEDTTPINQPQKQISLKPQKKVILQKSDLSQSQNQNQNRSRNLSFVNDNPLQFSVLRMKKSLGKISKSPNIIQKIELLNFGLKESLFGKNHYPKTQKLNNFNQIL